MFLGGSVVLGHFCFENSQIGNELCAYPNRVGNLLNSLFVDDSLEPFDLSATINSSRTKGIKISNLAIGGISTLGVAPILPILLDRLNSQHNVDKGSSGSQQEEDEDEDPTAIFIDFSVNDVLQVFFDLSLTFLFNFIENLSISN